jgi:AAHS family 3-hydroxyphenylpropionic acid transporter
LLLCAAAAVFEGFDNQSMGVAAPRLAVEFALTSAQKGWIFAAAPIGLSVGASLAPKTPSALKCYPCARNNPLPMCSV